MSAICQLKAANVRSTARMAPEITRMIVLILFDMASGSRIARVQCHQDLVISGAAAGAIFAKDLDIRKGVGILKGFQEL